MRRVRKFEISARGDKWNGQELQKAKLIGSTKRRDSDLDFVLRHVELERSVQAIPDGQNRRPVRVRFGSHDRMMHAVHPRRDDALNEHAFKIDRQSEVGVVKENCRDHQLLPEVQRPGRDSDEKDLAGTPADRHDELADVKPHGGRGVHVEVRVVDDVETPQQRNTVREDVPEIERVIEKHDRQQGLGPLRHVESLQQANPVTNGHCSQSIGDRPLQKTQCYPAHRSHDSVTQIASECRLDRTTQRPPSLEPDERAHGNCRKTRTKNRTRKFEHYLDNDPLPPIARSALECGVNHRFGFPGALIVAVCAAPPSKAAIHAALQSASRNGQTGPLPIRIYSRAPMTTPHTEPRRILVVDDDPKTAASIRLYLEREGYETVVAHGGRRALELARSESPDLLVLDLMLPEVDGYEICRALRTESSVPIVMLTARATEEDKLRGLDLGADDYIAKPFSPRELVARVRAVLRRASASGAIPDAGATLSYGDLRVDTRAHTVSSDGRPIHLTPAEFKLLELFVRSPGRAFTRRELADRALGWDFDGFDRTVDAHVKNLRKKLGDGGARIETVYGVGYRLGGDPDAR